MAPRSATAFSYLAEAFSTEGIWAGGLAVSSRSRSSTAAYSACASALSSFLLPLVAATCSAGHSRQCDGQRE